METLSQVRHGTTHMASQKRKVSIVALGREGSQVSSQHLKALSEMIVRSDDKYPGIDRWFAQKVVPGLRSGERRAYVAFENERPIATAILRIGRSSKICHLRVDENRRQTDLGQLFLIQMTMDVLGVARELHFTLPESVWATTSGFFKSFGFSSAAKTLRHYRKNDTELACSAPLSTVYSAAIRKIPRLLGRLCIGRHSEDTDVLMSVKPSFAQRILAGSKYIEIRKRFSRRWAGHKLVLYASYPLRAIVGEAMIDSVTTGPPADIWSRFESGIGCSKSDFDAYVRSADEIVAIELKNVVPFKEYISLRELSSLMREKLIPPQSFLELTSHKTGPWMNALYLAALLQERRSTQVCSLNRASSHQLPSRRHLLP